MMWNSYWNNLYVMNKKTEPFESLLMSCKENMTTKCQRRRLVAVVWLAMCMSLSIFLVTAVFASEPERLRFCQ